MSPSYYNDNDPRAAAWLRKLIAAGAISPGDVDERSIEEVGSADLAGYTRIHLFAGIGAWDYALELAGWPEDLPIWTGSCPCQPVSGAGKRQGPADARHLWPAFHRLIADGGPSVCFGEQVDGPIGREWIAGVRADLEALGYAVGIGRLPAASVGAPHKRNRLWFVADADSNRWAQGYGAKAGHEQEMGLPPFPAGGVPGNVGDAAGERRESASQIAALLDEISKLESAGSPGTVAHAHRERLEGRLKSEHAGEIASWTSGAFGAAACLDGRYRRIPFEPELYPLAPRIPGRVGLLRGLGNAIVPQLAAVFIRAYMEVGL